MRKFMRQCLGHFFQQWFKQALYTDMFLLSYHMSKKLGYLPALYGCFFLKDKNAKLIWVKIPWVCKILTLSKLTEQELELQSR